MTNFKKYFPIFKSIPALIYLDNGASTQTCEASLKAMNDYYFKYRANTRRGSYELADKATAAFENARSEIAEFFHAEPREIIFTSGATHGLNLLAYSLSPRLSHRNNVVLTRFEHHANLVPWQQMAHHYGFELRFIDLDKDFNLDLDSAAKLIDKNTKIVSFALVSNVLGSIAPAKKIIKLAKDVGALTIIDAAQAAAHLKVDVKNLGVDFLVCSGHKMYGPTGIGVLFGKYELLSEHLEPFFYGGDMVSSVTFERAEWMDVPHRFEAGTQNIGGAIGLGAAVKFIRKIGWKKIRQHESELTKYSLDNLKPLVQIFGNPKASDRIGVIAFNLNTVHPHDTAEIIRRHKVAIRSGLHCAEPLHKLYGLPGSARLSLSIYNQKKDIDELKKALQEAVKIFNL